MDPKQNELEKEELESVSSDEIRGNIQGTRRNMDETLEELGERLHPRHLLDDLLEIFRDSPKGSASRDRITSTSKRVGSSIGRELREHPLPALLVGAGLVWWIIDATTEDLEKDSSQREIDPGTHHGIGGYMAEPSYPQTLSPSTDFEAGNGADDTMAEKAGKAVGATKDKAMGIASAAGEKISDAASSVSERVSEATSAVGQKISDAGDAARLYSARGSRAVSRQAGIMQQRLREASTDYPLAMGGALLAAGLLTGLLLPRTEQEDQWMGEASDELKDQTREKGEALLEQGKAAATRTATAALEEAEARGITPDTLADKAGHAISNATDAVKRAAKGQGIATSESLTG